MILLLMSILALVLAAAQTGLFLKNLPLFRRTCLSGQAVQPHAVSVLIPARDEEAGIGDTLKAILASETVQLEVVVMDDHSSDDTVNIVRRIAKQDSRVRLLHSEPLPATWNGKQHACAQLADAAAYDRLVFLDADVRLQPHALEKLMAYQDETAADLLSAFPHQITGTVLEKCLIPMMHYILLCFLPISRMRSSNHPAYASGCGQLFMTDRKAYVRAGTHKAIRASRHDGLKLPHAYRQSGQSTDVIDGTGLASCRMYTSAKQVIRGLLKNADEGIANPKLILPFSVMLIGSATLPVVLLGSMLLLHSSPIAPAAIFCAAGAIFVGHLPRALCAFFFRQSWFGVITHSLGVAMFVSLQWIALAMHFTGRQVAWRGRIENQRPSTT